MKLSIIISFIVLPFLLSGQIIDSVNVYYLPWKFNIEGKITDDLVRNYPGYSEVVKITDRQGIDSLVFSLSIFNLRPKENAVKASFSPRMVIDVFSHARRSDPNSPVCVHTLRLDQRQNLVYQDRVYYKNFGLEEWIKNYILIED